MVNFSMNLFNYSLSKLHDFHYFPSFLHSFQTINLRLFLLRECHLYSLLHNFFYSTISCFCFKGGFSLLLHPQKRPNPYPEGRVLRIVIWHKNLLRLSHLYEKQKIIKKFVVAGCVYLLVFLFSCKLYLGYQMPLNKL